MLIAPSLPRQTLAFDVPRTGKAKNVVLAMSTSCLVRSLHVEGVDENPICMLKHVKLAGVPANGGPAPLTIRDVFMCRGQTVDVEIEGLAPGRYTLVVTTKILTEQVTR